MANWLPPARTAGEVDGLARLVILALEAGASRAHQRRDDPQRLLETIDAVIEGEPVHVVLVGVPTAAEAEHEVALADIVDGLRHLGDRAGVMERGARHHSADGNSW